MFEIFARDHFAARVRESLGLTLRQLPNLWAAGAPAFLILLFSLKLNAGLCLTRLPGDGTIPAAYLLSLILVNIIRLWALGQALLVWTWLGNPNFSRISVAGLVTESLKGAWRMVVPIIPLWIILPCLLNFLAALYVGLGTLLGSIGGGWLSAGLVWLTLLLWPALAVLAAKILYVPCFAAGLQKPAVFLALLTSLRLTSIRALKYHWSAHLLLTLPAVAGIIVPCALLGDNLLLLLSPGTALKIQQAGLVLFWLAGPLAIASAMRLYLFLNADMNSALASSLPAEQDAQPTNE